MVICKIKTKLYILHKNVKTVTEPKINLNNLEDNNLKEKYKEELSKRINCLKQITLEHNYSKPQNKAVKETGTEILGIKEKNNNKNSNNTVKLLSKEKYKLKQEKEKCNDLNLREEIQKERNRIGKEIQKELKSQENKKEIDRIKSIENS